MGKATNINSNIPSLYTRGFNNDYPRNEIERLWQQLPLEEQEIIRVKSNLISIENQLSNFSNAIKYLQDEQTYIKDHDIATRYEEETQNLSRLNNRNSILESNINIKEEERKNKLNDLIKKNQEQIDNLSAEMSIKYETEVARLKSAYAQEVDEINLSYDAQAKQIGIEVDKLSVSKLNDKEYNMRLAQLSAQQSAINEQYNSDIAVASVAFNNNIKRNEIDIFSRQEAIVQKLFRYRQVEETKILGQYDKIIKPLKLEFESNSTQITEKQQFINTVDNDMDNKISKHKRDNVDKVLKSIGKQNLKLGTKKQRTIAVLAVNDASSQLNGVKELGTETIEKLNRVKECSVALEYSKQLVREMASEYLIHSDMSRYISNTGQLSYDYNTYLKLGQYKNLEHERLQEVLNKNRALFNKHSDLFEREKKQASGNGGRWNRFMIERLKRQTTTLHTENERLKNRYLVAVDNTNNFVTNHKESIDNFSKYKEYVRVNCENCEYTDLTRIKCITEEKKSVFRGHLQHAVGVTKQKSFEFDQAMAESRQTTILFENEMRDKNIVPSISTQSIIDRKTQTENTQVPPQVIVEQPIAVNPIANENEQCESLPTMTQTLLPGPKNIISTY